VESELRELYQQTILDHHRKPRNLRGLPDADRRAEGFNPLCGDRVSVELKLGPDGRYADVAFTGSGCAICTASASMMTECLRGRTPAEAEALFDGFHRLVTGETEPGAAAEALGKLTVFAGVREFPVRVKCATLPWHTFHAAASGSGGAVTTE
jgi:nitrogen fixation NifU-like protein